ncbi:MAG: hypothetical protein IKC53_08450, partial [Lentisphaeria bacterium]|nr:hypothetical protein [Lentisphaeria bacterium]
RLNDTDIRLQLDRPLPQSLVLGKDVVENADWTPDLTVRSCDFGPTSGRGILCTTRGKVTIEHNRFEKLWGPALLIEDDCNFWFESGYTREIVFRENEVIDCEYGHMWPETPVIRYSPKVMDENSTTFVHGKLTLADNRFSKPQGEHHSIWLEYLAEASGANALYLNLARMTPAAAVADLFAAAPAALESVKIDGADADYEVSRSGEAVRIAGTFPTASINLR